ncbi:MAG: alpha-L-fucosidase [Bacteroidota bacterium]|nr:alpha-L-fucosidase [Bacteroidota bacterium]
MRTKNFIISNAYYFVVLPLLISILFIEGCSDNSTDVIKENPIVTSQIKSPPIEPCYPVPTDKQLEWQDSEIMMFIHFGINTFTNKEWGDGTEDPLLFNPRNLNVLQWVQIAKEIGFKYVILTAKHHDGFCLWPSKYTNHSIKYSPYKNGNGDIVKEFADACHANGIKFCIYLSPWDRHESTYGSSGYDIYYQNQLIELLTNYGDIGEFWFDGAPDPSYGIKLHNYNWDLYWSTVRYYQPDVLMANWGPDIRWVGNEEGLGYETEWAWQTRNFSMQKSDSYNKVWYPAEADVSIRPGWFYHSSEDFKIKTVDQLVDIYLKTVGRNTNLLLNVPPNTDGQFSSYDIQRLRDWKRRLSEIFAKDLFFGKEITCSNVRNNSDAYSAKNCLDNNRNTFWVTDKDINNAVLDINLGKKEKINIIRLEEAVRFGQRIKAFEVDYDNNGTMETIFSGTTIGHSRIITFPAVETEKIRILIKDSYAAPTLCEIKGYYSDQIRVQ